MIFNKENEILKSIFEKEEINIPSKSILHTLLINTEDSHRIFLKII